MMSEPICDNCKAVFDEARGEKQKSRFASIISAVLNCTECKDHSHSVISSSPCVVADSEDLAVCACHPNQLLEDGTLSTNIVDAAYLHGMSVTRIEHHPDGVQGAQDFCAVTFPRLKHGKPARKWSAGIAIFQAEDARSIPLQDGSSAYRVYDTDNPTIPAHADVVATRYFGKAEDLPVGDQLQRELSQLAFVKKMQLIGHS